MLRSDLRNFERTLIASMVSLFSLYRTKWQKLPRFLGQKCFLGALMETEKSRIYGGEHELLSSVIQTSIADSSNRTTDLIHHLKHHLAKKPNFDL